MCSSDLLSNLRQVPYPRAAAENGAVVDVGGLLDLRAEPVHTGGHLPIIAPYLHSKSEFCHAAVAASNHSTDGRSHV